MPLTFRHTMLSLAILPLLAGCERQNDKDAVSQAQTPAPSASGAGEAAREQDQAAQPFLTLIGQSNQYEIASAQIALERTRSNEIREFARMMLMDHQKSAENMRQISSEMKNLVIPKMPSDQQQASLAALRESSNFDNLYLQQQRRAHEETLGPLRRFAESGDPPALRAYAAKILPAISGHYDMLRQLETNISPVAPNPVPDRKS